MQMTRRRAMQLALMGPYAATVGGDARGDDARDPVTLRMAKFIIRTRYDDLPPELIELGKKSILDGAGLALVGSVAKSGAIGG